MSTSTPIKIDTDVGPVTVLWVPQYGGEYHVHGVALDRTIVFGEKQMADPQELRHAIARQILRGSYPASEVTAEEIEALRPVFQAVRFGDRTLADGMVSGRCSHVLGDKDLATFADVVGLAFPVEKGKRYWFRALIGGPGGELETVQWMSEDGGRMRHPNEVETELGLFSVRWREDWRAFEVMPINETGEWVYRQKVEVTERDVRERLDLIDRQPEGTMVRRGALVMARSWLCDVAGKLLGRPSFEVTGLQRDQLGPVWTAIRVPESVWRSTYKGKLVIEHEAALDDVVYTAIDGTKFHRFDDPRLVEAVKRADARSHADDVQRSLVKLGMYQGVNPIADGPQTAKAFDEFQKRWASTPMAVGYAAEDIRAGDLVELTGDGAMRKARPDLQGDIVLTPGGEPAEIKFDGVAWTLAGGLAPGSRKTIKCSAAAKTPVGTIQGPHIDKALREHVERGLHVGEEPKMAGFAFEWHPALEQRTHLDRNGERIQVGADYGDGPSAELVALWIDGQCVARGKEAVKEWLAKHNAIARPCGAGISIQGTALVDTDGTVRGGPFDGGHLKPAGDESSKKLVELVDKVQEKEAAAGVLADPGPLTWRFEDDDGHHHFEDDRGDHVIVTPGIFERAVGAGTVCHPKAVNHPDHDVSTSALAVDENMALRVRAAWMRELQRRAAPLAPPPSGGCGHDADED